MNCKTETTKNHDKKNLNERYKPKANEAAVLTSSLWDENESRSIPFNSGILLKSL